MTLFIVSEEREQIVSQRRKTTFSSDANTSILKQRFRNTLASDITLINGIVVYKFVYYTTKLIKYTDFTVSLIGSMLHSKGTIY